MRIIFESDFSKVQEGLQQLQSDAAKPVSVNLQPSAQPSSFAASVGLQPSPASPAAANSPLTPSETYYGAARRLELAMAPNDPARVALLQQYAGASSGASSLTYEARAVEMQNRITGRTDSNFDRAALSSQKADERRVASVDNNFDRAALAAQKADERAAVAKQRIAEIEEKRAVMSDDQLTSAKRQYELAKAPDSATRQQLLKGYADEEGGEKTVQGLKYLTQAETEGPSENPPGSSSGGRGRAFGLGRLLQYTTGGFVANELLKLGGAFQTSKVSEALAGSDLKKQVESQLQYNESATSVPLVGPLVSFVRGDAYVRGGIQGQLNSADATDQRTEQIGANAEYRRNLANSYNINTAGATSSYSASRFAIDARRQDASMDAERQRRQDSQSFEAQHNAERSSLEADVLAAGEWRKEDFGHGISAAKDRVAAAQARLTAFDNSSGVDRASLSLRQAAAADLADKAASAQASSDIRNLNNETDARAYGRQFSTAQNYASGRNDSFTAQALGISGKTAQDFTLAQPEEKLQVLKEGASQLSSFFSQTARGLKNATDDINSKTNIGQLRVAGFGYAASIADIEDNRRRQLRDLPDNYISNPALKKFYDENLGGNDRRDAINRSADFDVRKAGYDEQSRTIAASGSLAANIALLNRDPLAATTAQLNTSFAARNVGRSNFSAESIFDRLGTFAQTALAEQQQRDQIQSINLSQSTQRAQLNALLNRDPTGADVAGIVGNTRATELGFLQRGPAFAAQAATTRSLGQEQLDLTRQNYTDSFRGEETDLRKIFTQSPRDAEDPGKVLGEISSARDSLNKPGNINDPSGGGLGSLFSSLIAEVQNNLPRNIATEIAAIVAQ